MYFKELAYVIVEAGQIQNLIGEGRKPGDRGKACSLIPVAVCWEPPLLLWGGQSLF